MKCSAPGCIFQTRPLPSFSGRTGSGTGPNRIACPCGHGTARRIARSTPQNPNVRFVSCELVGSLSCPLDHCVGPLRGPLSGRATRSGARCRDHASQPRPSLSRQSRAGSPHDVTVSVGLRLPVTPFRHERSAAATSLLDEIADDLVKQFRTVFLTTDPIPLSDAARRLHIHGRWNTR